MGGEIEGAYRSWKAVAEKRGWHIPTNDALPMGSWISYWRSMEEYERKVAAGDPNPGRPVIPHR